ncbi:MAG: 1-deoxy-D-xylulose-5-phosphate reductoisomerase [Ruminococcaceae bacterium]|nr:1-deoxy-D-xylulose-5-phosphate reductoisomerase [Oscillospiraceae bacterium]
MMKKINLLGSTGSIGVQTLDVARARGYKIESLAAFSNVDIIEKQIREFKPAYAALVDEKAAADLKVRVADLPVKVYSGLEGVSFCGAEAEGEITLNSVVGMAGLKPTLDAVNAGKIIALANKETLVAGGKLVTDAAKKNNVPLLPVDSEHSAIFQCLLGAPRNSALKRIILTASGGPFFGKTRAELEKVTLADALKHPSWSMGQKITIDSATMFNKGLELIEAVWLFDVSPDMIDIVVHRESIVHSLIEYDDNSVIAQLGHPDMRLPIQFAITYPDRFPSPEKQLDLWEVGNLSFYKPDYENFPCMDICRNAIKKGGLIPAAVNCANEEANLLFRQGKISFLQIPEFISKAAEYAPDKPDYTLQDVLDTDILMREKVRELASI